MSDSNPFSRKNLGSWISRARLVSVGCSIADQACSVGGMFLANIALARTQSKEEYGIFALSYSVFTFLAGLHNAAILEAYTIYGAGRYHKKFSAYGGMIWRSHLVLVLGLTALLVLAWGVLAWTTRVPAPRTFLGMALACGVLLTALFLRRTFYIRRRPELAALFSAIYCLLFAALLWISLRAGILNGFSAYAIAGLAWCGAEVVIARELPRNEKGQKFLALVPGYWKEHWNYSRWVLVTALVFQFTTQAYYWLAAGILSVKEVANLRAMYNIVAPVEQVFVAVALLILPMMSHRYAERRMAGLLPLWKMYGVATLAITGGFAALVNGFGKPALHLLYAGKFDDLAPLAGALALLPMVMGIGNTMNAALKAMEKPQAVFYAYATSGAATFLVGIPLLRRFGLRGAVYGMIASAGAYSLALGIAFLLSLQQHAAATGLAATASEGLFRSE